VAHGAGETVAVIGLGYVGMPLAVALSRSYPVIGFDLDPDRVAELQAGLDRTSEVPTDSLRDASAEWTTDPARLRDATFFIVTVPTPVDDRNIPDFGPLRSSSLTVGRHLSPGAVVVYESTVYPGATREVCVPILEDESGLKCGVDFFVGYSPERINPGDTEHTLERVVKVIAGQDEATAERMASVYGTICHAGLHVASSIEVAEAAKVIENTQRDLNIALMNELALIFDRIGISTSEVLAAARTKWNFLDFVPGLVGGHCIGVDPYYLTHKAEAVGYHPQVILAGRRVNDSVAEVIATKTLKLLVASGVSIGEAKVSVLGLTFKPDVPDIRNSKVPDLVEELGRYGVTPSVHDPLAPAELARSEYGIVMSDRPGPGSCDAVILAVPHRSYLAKSGDVWAQVREGGVLVDVKGALAPDPRRPDVTHWSL
jgi:UDP-N-acetyl-D-glucosamine/UDP-N-acetyl-D-galactosamine dehydrogenase